MIEETLLEAGDKMDKAVEVAKEDFASIRTGRGSRVPSTRSAAFPASSDSSSRPPAPCTTSARFTPSALSTRATTSSREASGIPRS